MARSKIVSQYEVGSPNIDQYYKPKSKSYYYIDDDESGKYGHKRATASPDRWGEYQLAERKRVPEVSGTLQK